MSTDWRRIIKRPLTLALARYERALLNSAGPLSQPPIFVLGVARSGTTVLYQLLLHCFDVSYFCNAANEHSLYPVAMTRILRSHIRKYESDFISNYGRTKGGSNASGGSDIWRRWLPENYVDERYLSADAADMLRRTVAAVSAVIGVPFLNKCTHHCVWVRALNAIFPGCLFVYIRRDPVATAASILNVRMKRAARGQGDLTTWIDAKPKEYASISQTGYITQICGQVYYIAHNALDDLQAVAHGRYLIVSFEDLCTHPGRQVDRIGAFARSNGVPLRQRGDPPASFDLPDRVPIPETDREAIRTQLVQLYGESVIATSNRP